MANINFEYASGSDRTFTWPNVTGTVAVPTFVSLSDGATITVPWVPNSHNFVQLGGNRTITFSGTPSPGESLTLILQQDGTGGRTVTYSDAMIWPKGTQAVLTTTAFGYDIIEIRCRVVSLGTPTYLGNSLSLGASSASAPAKQTITDGATITLAWLHNSVNVVTLGGNRTWAFSGSPAVEEQLLIRIIQDATGGRTVTWPSSGVTINWVGGGVAPVLTTTASKVDVIGLRCTDPTGGALKFEGWIASQNGAA
jgi:hypothetical protein